VGTSPNALGWSVASFYTCPAPVASPEFSAVSLASSRVPEKVWLTAFHRCAGGQVLSNRGFARALDGSGSSPPESDLATAPATPPAGAVPRPRSFWPRPRFPQRAARLVRPQPAACSGHEPGDRARSAACGQPVG